MKNAYRDLRIRIIHDANWNFFGFGLMGENSEWRKPTFTGTNPVEMDITEYVLQWNASWTHGSPMGNCSLNCVPFKEFQYLNTNDVIIIDQAREGTRERDLIFCGLLNEDTFSLAIAKDGIKGNFTISASEPSKYLVTHELFYNQFSERSSNPYFAWASQGLILGAKRLTGDSINWEIALQEGFPFRMIQKIIRAKMFGEDVDGNETEFYGGFYLNDGRRIKDWYDIDSKIVDLKNAVRSGASGTVLIKYQSDPIVLAFPIRQPDVMEGPIWNIIKQYSCEPLWELYTHCEYNENKEVKQIIHFRPLPFWDRHYQWNLWDNLPTLEFTKDDWVNNGSFRRSDNEAFNFFLIRSSTGILNAERIFFQHYKESLESGKPTELPIIMGRLIQKYGFKKFWPNINGIPMANTDMEIYAQDIIKAAGLRIFDHNFLNAYFLNGNFTMPLPYRHSVPRTGWKVKDLDTKQEGYLTGVTISGGMGMPTNLTCNVTRYIRREDYQYMIDKKDFLISTWTGENI